MSLYDNDSEKGKMVHAFIKAPSKNTVYKVSPIPDWVKYIKLYPKTGVFTIAFDEDPAIGTELIPNVTTKVIPVSGFSVGGILVNSNMEVRQPSFPSNRELRYVSDTDNGVCIIEFAVG
jgi:hypothetical protein